MIITYTSLFCHKVVTYEAVKGHQLPAEGHKQM